MQVSNSDRVSHAGSGLKRLLRELCCSGRMRSGTALSKSPAAGTCACGWQQSEEGAYFRLYTAPTHHGTRRTTKLQAQP